MAEIVLEHLTKRFPDGSLAVNDFNLNIGDGEFVILVGPSGCGKSTTLRMIAGLEDVSSGEIRIGERVVNDLPPKDRDIAMVFQNYALYPHMTVADNLAFGLKLRHTPKAEIKRRVGEAAEMLGLTEFLDRKPDRLTGGELGTHPLVRRGLGVERAAGGVTVSQLITDFGRTSNLVASANLSARAEAQNAMATQEQILLEVNQAFFNALQTHAVLRVAEETVNARALVADQIGALAKNKLKSDLDLSFANVNLAQAKLLLLDAQNNDKAALANLSAVLGFSTQHDFILIEDKEQPSVPLSDIDTLIAEAFAKRPEMLALNYQFQASQKFRNAERDLLLPTIRALGVVGGAPIRNDHLSSWYGAVGANMDIPIFNGFLYTARAHEADLRSQAVRDRLADLRNRISRDVRTSWLSANNAYQRLAVTQQLLEQAQLALELAQARYKLGLGSIVELSQAQLQATQAEITNAQAGYDYRLAQAVLRYETTGL